MNVVKRGSSLYQTTPSAAAKSGAPRRAGWSRRTTSSTRGRDRTAVNA
jgi:hypothetical protein